MSTAAPTPARRRFDPFRWIVENPAVVDAVVFGGIAGILALFSLVAHGPFALWSIFSVPMVAVGVLGRRRPGLCALIIGILAVGHLLVGKQVVIGDAMIFYALFAATVHGTALVRRLALGAAMFGAALQAAITSVVFESAAGADAGLGAVPAVLIGFVSMTIPGEMVVLGVWALGRYQHARLEQVRLVRERAEQAERERESRAALAVAGERARIAREMHDVVAHSLSVIIAQADGGRFVATQQPEKALEVLETIGRTGRTALADMRSLLGVLRDDEETSFGPQPDLSTLPDLLGRVRAAGLAVTEDVSGDLGSLPSSMSLSMFRLVQEALTNVLKHAGPGASAHVAIRCAAPQLAIDVTDDGRGADPDSDGQGHGLTGMRERVDLHGGTLLAGPLPGGGFRVSARIPLGRQEGAPALGAAVPVLGAPSPAAAGPRTDGIVEPHRSVPAHPPTAAQTAPPITRTHR